MSLHELVDDWEFKESEFMQYLEQSVISLAELLIRPELSDSKTRVFKCLLILVQRLESKIMPYVHDIFCHVRDAVQMYTSKAASDSDPIFMGTVIEMVCTLVSVLGYSQSQQNEQPDQPIFYIENFLEFIVPLIRYSIENSLHVLEDGTILWRYTLHSLSDTTLPLMVGNNHPASILLDLFISLCEMFEHCGSTEYFDDYFDLVSSYILLGIASTIPGPDNIYMNKLISVLTMLLDSDTYSSAVLEPITEIIDYLFLKNSEIAQTQLLLDCLDSSGFIESITKPSLLSSDYSKSYVALFISRLLVLPFSFGSLGSTFEPIISNIINHLVSTGIDLMDILVVGYQRYESVEYNPNNTRFQLLLAFATAILAGLGYGSNSVASPNNHAVTYTQLVNDVWLPTLAFNSEEEIISAISSEDSPSYELPHLHRRLVALKSDLVLNYPWKLFLHSRLMHLDLAQFRGNASGKGNELDPGYSQTKLSRNFLDFLATEMESAEFADEFAEMLQS
ncbi:hypothetical protein AX774_g2304 [Zancudomyces culisetae]|uniref:Importin-7/11-like TPR repeats domain-containing protein n=1 Tax=Zancudomyces culisetae TaxID=1213189 RepID=A0A1R1PT95_ZANCU|nr:hypothetical protein AX774_g2304 [Zancudomyces culisetae]|eukprot:OMH84188.1 hypothetical protein AX774_g2304 [Zancudomyces culisetae]